MAKVELIEETNGKISYTFYCPGCKCNHMYFIKGFNVSWEFNGSLDNPTFHPSLRNRLPDGQTCHLHVKNGKIEYCSDCSHELKSKTVEMEQIDAG